MGNRENLSLHTRSSHATLHFPKGSYFGVNDNRSVENVITV
jgi:hypothetical protein